MGESRTSPGAGVTEWLSERIVAARRARFEQPVWDRAIDRIVDSVGAIVSGGRLPPGIHARMWVQAMRGTGEATVVGDPDQIPAVNAALANAMMAHANETDDVDLVTKAHPGSSVIPAALAMGERHAATGEQFVRSVIVGYDVYCRMLRGMDAEALAGRGRSLQGLGSTFGAAAAAAMIAPVGTQQVAEILSFAAQQASGIATWPRDTDHIEKAFDLAGMGARNGVTAATMVASGMTGVQTVFDGDPPGLGFLSMDADSLRLMAEPDEWRVESAIKPYPVGYPIQAALEAILRLMASGVVARDVESLTVQLPPDGARIVDGRQMPSINAQHVLALALVDGVVTFDNVHDESRFTDNRIQAIVSKTDLVPDPDMWDPDATRQARVSITLVDGRVVSEHVRFARGTPQNPLSAIQVDSKAHDLMVPVLGTADCGALITDLRRMATLTGLEEVSAKLRAAQLPTPIN